MILSILGMLSVITDGSFEQRCPAKRRTGSNKRKYKHCRPFRQFSSFEQTEHQQVIAGVTE